MTRTARTNQATLSCIGGAVLTISLALLAGCELSTASNHIAVVARRSDEVTKEPPVTVPPTTEAPTTTLPAPSTTLPVELPIPVVPAAPAIPAGGLDLGDGVFVVPSAGWTTTVTNGNAHLTDGIIDVTAQVVRRTPGENPKVVLDEYVASFEQSVNATSFTPATLRWSSDAPRSTMQYGSYYTVFSPDAASGQGITGGLSAYVRNDGLTLVYDIWGPADVAGVLPDDMFNSLLDSFLAAPEVAAPVALTPVADFRITSITDPAIVTGVVGFTPAPGFTVLVEGEGAAVTTTGTTDFGVIRLTGAIDSADALRQSQSNVLNAFPDATFVGEVNYGADEAGVIRHGIAWNGTFNGAAWGGGIDVFFDPATGSAYVVKVSWEWGEGETPPLQTSTDFMFTSFTDSFTNVA
jgi:hypothetical protein